MMVHAAVSSKILLKYRQFFDIICPITMKLNITESAKLAD